MPQPGDRLLVQRAKRGDRDAFGELVDRYMGYVYGYAYARLLNHEDTEDAAQDTFMRAYERLNQLREPDHFESWLMRIALSRTSERARRRGREEPVAEPYDPDAPEPGETGQERFEREEDTRRMLDAALATLPETIRVPLVMRHVTGHSYEDIARALMVSPNAVERRVSRARERLRDYFRRAGARDVVFDVTVTATVGRAAIDLAARTTALIRATPDSPARTEMNGRAHAHVGGPAFAATGLVLGGLALVYWAGFRADLDGVARQRTSVHPGTVAEATVLFGPDMTALPAIRELIRPGSEAEGWEAAWPANDPAIPVPGRRGLSGRSGASVSNDHGVFRPLGAVRGEITLHVWMQPAMGEQSAAIGFVCDGQRTGVATVVKDHTGRWTTAAGGVETFLGYARPEGHDLTLVYRTDWSTLDVRLDGKMVASDVHYPENVGKAVVGVNMGSGRGGIGAATYFGNLSVSVRERARGTAPTTVTNQIVAPVLRDSVRLAEGSVNGVPLDSTNPVIYARPGEMLRGHLTVDVFNSHGEESGFHVIETPTWGEPRESFGVVARNPPPGRSQQTIALDRPAPSVPGVYHIIVAAAAETRPDEVASGTSWTNDGAVWGNGLDIASWDAGVMREAMETGSVEALWLMNHGARETRQLGAAAIPLTVRR